MTPPPDFRPSDVVLHSPPLVAAMGKTQAEHAAAILVLHCRASGDEWRPVPLAALPEFVRAEAGAGREPLASLCRNLLFRPDVHELVSGGYAEWTGGAIAFTAAGFEALSRHVRPTPDLAELLRRARDAFDALTPDEQIHHRHLQRISFAVGNVGLSRPDVLRDTLERLALDAAGPCPCGRCSPRLVVADPSMVRSDTTCPATTVPGSFHTHAPGAERCFCGQVSASQSTLSCKTCGGLAPPHSSSVVHKEWCPTSTDWAAP